MTNKNTGFRFQVSAVRGYRRILHFLKAESWQLKANQRGFTLLLAALVASIVLALGASIFEIAQKQVTLSSIGRNSQFAFYAADTAAECALYWDLRFSYFTPTTPPTSPDPACDTQTLVPFTVLPEQNQPYAYPYTMISQQVNLFTDTSPAGGYCAQFTIQKSLDPITSAVRTVIHADGYSVNCDSIFTSSQALQRSVELHY